MNIQTITTKNLKKGFTLVEVIVVAVIIAVLAGVAVPLYLGYVDDSRTNSAANAAGAIATFCGACRNTAGTLSGYDVTGSEKAPAAIITCTGSGTPATITTIKKPVDILIGVTVPANAGAAGIVTGIHSKGGTASTYNY